MAGLEPCSASLLLALLLPLALPLEGGREAQGSEAPAAPAAPGAPSLPLMQRLLGQAPPRAWLPGLSRRRVSGQPLRYMRNLYRSVADPHGRPRRDGRLSSNTIRLVRPSAKARQAAAGPWFIWALDYRLEVQAPAQRLVRAVAVYIQRPSSPHGPLWCTATLLPGGSALPEVMISPALLKNSTATPAADSWVELDLSSHLQPWSWAAQNSHLLRLHHACAFLDWAWSSPRGPGGEPPPSLEDPFLLLYLNDTWTPLRAPVGGELPQSSVRGHRMRRAEKLDLSLPRYSRHGPSTKQNACALYPLRVTFRQLGWDHWIIAPHSYRPQYCRGTCPRVLRYGYNSPNHAIVQNLINEFVDSNVPRPSCVPHEYSPVGVLMIEQNNNILFKVYEDMIAKSCTCR
ncbi:LOW QUALITY PROTEIN: bone morphogenetic protein 15 [Pseudonaja textilis]|uniref:LOW QUALITY PROTEIN: bone morphogenetic protein 15 n=1 Tax=Pseudonaja textilis TaxID=8673 RepID=UPI000EA8C207|nr:LOW QUALITY PROTEIN: bone morphogenetic protein 15 [Pseudonaja textilis]